MFDADGGITPEFIDSDAEDRDKHVKRYLAGVEVLVDLIRGFSRGELSLGCDPFFTCCHSLPVDVRVQRGAALLDRPPRGHICNSRATKNDFDGQR